MIERVERTVCEVWQFTVPEPGPDTFSISMPEEAEILTLQIQYGHPQIWALIDPSLPMVDRQFRIAGTGHPITESVRYVGTFQVHGGTLVFHVFEVAS